MEIKPQDVYLPVDGKSILDKNIFLLIDKTTYPRGKVEKHTGMVVMSVKKFKKLLKDAKAEAIKLKSTQTW